MYYRSLEGKEQHYFYICISFNNIKAINFWCKYKEFSEQEKRSQWLLTKNQQFIPIFYSKNSSLKVAKSRIPLYRLFLIKDIILYLHVGSHVQCEPTTSASLLSRGFMKWWKGVNKKIIFQYIVYILYYEIIQLFFKTAKRKRNTLSSYVMDSQELVFLRRASK